MVRTLEFSVDRFEDDPATTLKDDLKLVEYVPATIDGIVPTDATCNRGYIELGFFYSRFRMGATHDFEDVQRPDHRSGDLPRCV